MGSLAALCHGWRTPSPSLVYISFLSREACGGCFISPLLLRLLLTPHLLNLPISLAVLLIDLYFVVVFTLR